MRLGRSSPKEEREPDAEPRQTSLVSGRTVVPSQGGLSAPPAQEVTAPSDLVPPPPVRRLPPQSRKASGRAARDAKRLGELLLGLGALEAPQLKAALLENTGSGKRLGEFLVELGVIGEQDLVVALAEQFGLPFADLRLRSTAVDASDLLAEARARELGAIPLESQDGEVLDVAISDPTRQDDVRRAFDHPIRLMLTSPAELRRAIENTYCALVDVDREVAAFTVAAKVPPEEQWDGTSEHEAAPVVRIVTMLLTQALRDRASDVHIEPLEKLVRVRYRIDGALQEVLELPDGMASAVARRIKLMAEMNIVERRRPQNGQITTTVDGRTIHLRVSTAGTVWGEKIVLRIFDKTRTLYSLNDLGMPPETLAAFSKLIRSPNGMIICAGPTDSGRTTTAYASMSEVNGPDRNITTIEDPVEYVLPSINQMQIDESVGITFAGTLMSLQYQDPDLILVGEIRDAQTARIAAQAAVTGRLVLSSVHATDAIAALYRFLDMGIEPFLVASSVIGVVGQRLVRRICPDCRETYQPSADEMEFFRASGGSAEHVFWRGTGCRTCSDTGYLDRIGIHELLVVTEQMRELLVRQHPSREELRRLAIEQGMKPLRAEGIRLVEQDETTISEIVRSIHML